MQLGSYTYLHQILSSSKQLIQWWDPTQPWTPNNRFSLIIPVLLVHVCCGVIVEEWKTSNSMWNTMMLWIWLCVWPNCIVVDPKGYLTELNRITPQSAAGDIMWVK